MKRMLYQTLVVCLVATATFNQSTAQTVEQVIVEKKVTVKRDSMTSSKNINISLGVEDNENKVHYPRAFGGLTFTRIDWGFSRLLDNGKFTLSEENSFLSYKKASNFGFDIAQFGLRFNDNFKSYISTGFEWNYLRLKENILLKENSQYLDYQVIDKADVDYKKNILTSTYLRIPLTFEWRSNQNSQGKRMKVAFGAMTGILLKGTQRLKSDVNGKQKFKDNYNLASFQYGPFIRIGYNNLGIFSKYYVNDMFENSPKQKGLHNLTFGATLGF